MDEVLNLPGHFCRNEVNDPHGWEYSFRITPTLTIEKIEIEKDDFKCRLRESTKWITGDGFDFIYSYDYPDIFDGKEWDHPGDEITFIASQSIGDGGSEIRTEWCEPYNYGFMTDNATAKYFGSYMIITIGNSENLYNHIKVGFIVSDTNNVDEPALYQFGFGTVPYGQPSYGDLGDFIDELLDPPKWEGEKEHWSVFREPYRSCTVPVHIRIEVPDPLPQYIIKSLDEFNELIPRLLQENNNDLSRFTIAIMDNDTTNSNPYRFPNSIVKTPARVIKQNGNYSEMFMDCTNLEWVSPTIIWRVTNSMARMFKGCSSITSELPTTAKSILNSEFNITKYNAGGGGHHTCTTFWTDWCRGCINIANKDVLADQI